VNRSWPVDALAFEESVEAALAHLGGFEYTRECEADPARRCAISATVKTLELDQLDFAADEVEAAAAALATRAAGRIVAPWPLVQQLTARAGGDADLGAVYLVAGAPRRAEHLDLAGPAIAFDVRDGSARELLAGGPVRHMPLDPFGAPCKLGEPAAAPANAIVVSTVLSAYWVLGALETAVELASAYSVEREQFGRPIYNFGAIQWRLADLAVDVASLSEVAAFTLARAIDGAATLADAWALRLQMLESANRVLTDAHQVFGAIGLCEEHDLVIVDRHLQGLLRRPFGETRTATALAERVADQGFELLYPIEPLDTKERVAAA
jgi:hypothetical protein